MDVVVEDGSSLEDAMRIKNDSQSSELADFGSKQITDAEIDSVFASLSVEDEDAESR